MMKLKNKKDSELHRSITIYGSRGGGPQPLWQRLPQWLRRGIVALFLIGFGGMGIFAANKGYSWFRGQQLDRNLEQAQIAARLQDWPKARNLSRSVLLGRPRDFEAYRIWQRALSELGEPRAYMASAQLFVDPRATREDRLDALRVLSLQAPQAVALGAYASLNEELRVNPDARAAISDLLLLRGEVDLVETLIRDVTDFGEHGQHPKAQLVLLRALCARPAPDRVTEARQIFANLVKDESAEEALAALLILAETPEGLAPGPPLPQLPEWVNSQHGATDLHHLVALNPLLEDSDAEGRKLIFSRAVTRFIQAAPGMLGTWLVRHGEAELAADVLEEIAKVHPEAFIARMHALLRQQRTEEIEALLTASPPSVDGVELGLVQVAAARFREDSAQETSAWSKVLYQALLDTSANRFIEVAQYAENLGVAWAAERAWVAAVRVGWGRLPLYKDFIPLLASLARQNRTHDLLAMYRSLMRYEAHNVELLNNYYYLALLHGVLSPGEVMVRSEQLASEHPEKPELFSAAAMAALMAGQPERTLEWLPVLDAAEQVTPLMRTALRGTALLLTDQSEEARELLKTVDWNSFLHQENLAFRKLLLSSQLNELPIPEVAMPEIVEGIEETPAWKNAIERIERDRVMELLPALPAPRIPTNELQEID